MYLTEVFVLIRLQPKEISAIKEAIYQYLPEARILIYGSRVDDKQIPELSIKNRILFNLYDSIGEQKIDIVYSIREVISFSQLKLGQ